VVGRASNAIAVQGTAFMKPHLTEAARVRFHRKHVAVLSHTLSGPLS